MDFGKTQAIYRIRDVSWSMWCHHINILVFFFAGLLSNQLAWFMAANLVNEVLLLAVGRLYHISFMFSLSRAARKCICTLKDVDAKNVRRIEKHDANCISTPSKCFRRLKRTTAMLD